MTGKRPQNTSWTYTGVPLNIQMYTHDTDLRTGFGDSRMTASPTPSTTAITIDRTVSWIVFHAANETRLSKTYLE